MYVFDHMYVTIKIKWEKNCNKIKVNIYAQEHLQRYFLRQLQKYFIEADNYYLTMFGKFIFQALASYKNP